MSGLDFWALGIFEGEGCIYIRKNKPQSHLFVRMTDLDVIQKLQRVLGGRITTCTKVEGNKQAWRWSECRKGAVAALLMKWLPHLSDRRAYTALNALDRIDGCY